MPTVVRGAYFYLYLFMDLFSRKIVGWQVYDSESTEQASALMQDICQRQGIEHSQLSVHSDNGSPMRGKPCWPHCNGWVLRPHAAARV